MSGFQEELHLIFNGTPRSVRSKRGSKYLTKTIEENVANIKKFFPVPVPVGCYIKLWVEIFSDNTREEPDLDRLNKISDAFEGLVYVNDRQIVDNRPRRFQSDVLMVTLELKTEPMAVKELNDIPIASLIPLLWGYDNYHVIRVQSLC